MAQKKADTRSKTISEEQANDALKTVELPPQQPKETKPRKELQGFEWSLLPDVDERLETCLWNADVTELSDVNTKPQRVIAALQAYYGVDLGKLRKAVKEYKA